MKTTKVKKDTSWKALFGSWELEQSADEFIDELKKDRNFSRKSHRSLARARQTQSTKILKSQLYQNVKY